MVDMEIKTMFEIIIGIIMMITITIAVVALMGGLMEVTISECIPAEYVATIGGGGKYCGLSNINNKVYCIGGDDCINATGNLCCPTQTKGAKNINGECCNVTKV